MGHTPRNLTAMSKRKVFNMIVNPNGALFRAGELLTDKEFANCLFRKGENPDVIKVDVNVNDIYFRADTRYTKRYKQIE